MKMPLQRLYGWRKKSKEPNSFLDCTLIVPTYRRPKEILELLNLLADFSEAPGEVVIVDGSPENEVNAAISGWVVTRNLEFDLVYVKSPAGLTRQRNVGVDACD